MIHTEAWYKEAVRPISLDSEVVRHATENALRDLEEEARTVQKWDLNRGFGHSILALENVRGDPVSFRVLWVPVEEGPRWGFDRGDFVGSTETGEKVVGIKFNAYKSPEEVLQMLEGQRSRQTIKDEVRSVLEHEITHALDVGAEKDRVRPEEDLTGYYQSPLEVRAYMQQIAQESLRKAETLGEDGLGWFSSPQELMEHLLSNSKTWHRLKKEWDAPTRKHVLQGVYKYLEDHGIWDMWRHSLESWREDLP